VSGVVEVLPGCLLEVTAVYLELEGPVFTVRTAADDGLVVNTPEFVKVRYKNVIKQLQRGIRNLSPGTNSQQQGQLSS
jgi:hypothetical protein